jgi:hypothetical protein
MGDNPFNAFLQKHGFAPAAKVEGATGLDSIARRAAALESDLKDFLPNEEEEATDGDQ